MKQCYSCNHSFDYQYKAYRASLCPCCQKEVKVCLNCQFYSPGKQHDCMEGVTETVKEKNRANFCDFFRLKETTAINKKPASKSNNAKQQFNALFDD